MCIFCSYCSKLQLSFLCKVEIAVEGLIRNYSKKIGSTAHIKLEQFEQTESIKMESDFQSPESPPMFQDYKAEREPIMIPTERSDSNQYYYDSSNGSSRQHGRDYKPIDHRYGDGRRGNERHRRSRSRSRSNEYSKYRARSRSHSRSHSRERKYIQRRSSSREKSYERSRSYNSRSPSRYSPNYHRRDDRRGDDRRREDRRRDDRRGYSRDKRHNERSRHSRDRDRDYSHDRDRDYSHDRDRDYSSSNRDYDHSRKTKTYSDEPKRDSRYNGTNVKSESSNGWDYRDSPSTSSSSRKPNPIAVASTSTSSNQYDSNKPFKIEMKHEFDTKDKSLKSKSNALTVNRFDSGAKAVDEIDFMRDTDIDFLEKKTHIMFGRKEELEELKRYTEESNEIENCLNNIKEQRYKNIAHEILNELQVELNESEPEDEPIPTVKQVERVITSHHESRIQNQFESHVDIRPDIRPVIPIENRTDNHLINRIESRVENRIVDSPRSPEPSSSMNSVPREERIALSSKYVRRSRVQTNQNERLPESSPPNSTSIPQPQQDPRLRNRIVPPIPSPSTSLTEQFNSYGNPQPVLHQSASSISHAQPIHHPANTFVPNLNRNFPPNRDVYQTPVHQPLFNEPYQPNRYQQQQFPNIVQNQSNLSPHTNNFNSNVGFGANSHNNPFRHNLHTNQNVSSEPQKETYADWKRRQQQEQARKPQPTVSSTTAQAQSTAAEPIEKSPIQSPNQKENTRRKDDEKEHSSVSSNTSTSKKTHFDKAFRGNNWNALKKPFKNSCTSFKIPKLNKSSTDTATTTRDSPENNVSTSTKPTNDTKNSSNRSDSKRRKSSETVTKRKRSVDAKKPESKRNDRNSLDTNEALGNEPDQTIVQPQVEPQPVLSAPQLANPTVDELLKMLSAQLPEDTASKLKEIVTKRNESNDDTVPSSTTPVQSMDSDNADKSMETQDKSETKSAAKQKPKPKKPHTNELDRLTADIRENIPDVVALLTSRRTCTLNAPKIVDISPKKTSKSAKESEQNDEVESEIGKLQLETVFHSLSGRFLNVLFQFK